MTKKIDKRAIETKQDKIRRLLLRKAGADLPTLQKATGWQPHSVRAAISGLRKAGYTIDHLHPGTQGTGCTYRITASPEGA